MHVLPRNYWITGLPSSGKSTLGAIIATRQGLTLLDADIIRPTFWPHLGMSDGDRYANVLGLFHLAAAVNRTGRGTVVCCISPDGPLRTRCVKMLQAVLVWTVAPQEVLQERDTRGLYRTYAAGRLRGLTGIDAPYDEPCTDEAIVVRTDRLSIDDCLQLVIR